MLSDADFFAILTVFIDGLMNVLFILVAAEVELCIEWRM